MRKDTRQTIKYFLYARKSSESEDRQVQSIDNQVERLVELAKNLKLQIIDVLSEARSAKKPDNRPVFIEMMERIDAGEADGILCWQINRISRNPIDSAQIQWSLQQGALRSIQTIDREYRPEDNVLLFNVESGMANQYILDLSKSVKRGNLFKVQNGWRPGMAPIGYLNELEEHTIIPDPDRFDVIRKAWDLMLTGNYTVPKIWKKLNDEWGFRTKKRRRSGGKPIALSSLYKIFTNTFYAGILEYKGEQYPAKHKPMVTLEEYDQVQVILGRKGKPRPKTYRFPFTGMIRCGECGCQVTAEKKKKFIKSEKVIRYYTYYHCTRRKRDVNCSQRKSIPEARLETMIKEEIEKLTVLPEFFDWAIEALNQDNDRETVDRQKVYEMQHQAVTKVQNELDNLTQMRFRELIDDEMFIRQRDILKEQIKQLQKELHETEKRADDWFELAEKAFQFARFAKGNFENGTLEEKKAVLSGLGSNFLLEDQKLAYSPHSYFDPIKKGYKPLEEEYLALEPNKNGLNKVKTELLHSVITRWQAR